MPPAISRLFLMSFIAMALVNGVSDDVVVLNASNFAKFIADNETVLVKFYAPWCGHCKNLEPIYSNVASTLKAEGSKIILAKINADDNRSVIEEYQISGYPTLKLFRKGVSTDYTGARKAEDLLVWCKEMLLPAVNILDNLNDDKDLVSSSAPVVFIATGFDLNDNLYQTFERLANEKRSYAKFFATKTGSHGFESRHLDVGTIKFEGTTSEELTEFIDENSLPYFGEIDQPNYLKYISAGKEMSWFFGLEADYNKYKKSFVAAARELRSKMFFVWLDTVKFPSVGDSFAIKQFPAVAYQSTHGRFILYNDAYDFNNKDEIIKFFTDVELGKIPKSIVSEEIPSEDDSPVKTVVGKSIEQLFEESKANSKAILLMIHAPFCEHCKNFMPIFEAFAKSLPSNAPIVVAKMNGNANESPLDFVKWDSFPTVLLFKEASIEAIPFEGDRTQEALKKFIDEHIGSLEVKTEL